MIWGWLVVLAVVVVVVGLPLLIIRVWLRYDPVMHDTYCTCSLCRERAIRKEVQRHEWRRQQREIEEAVQEMLRSTRR